MTWGGFPILHASCCSEQERVGAADAIQIEQPGLFPWFEHDFLLQGQIGIEQVDEMAIELKWLVGN